jgi:hypothetical protein
MASTSSCAEAASSNFAGGIARSFLIASVSVRLRQVNYNNPLREAIMQNLHAASGFGPDKRLVRLLIT